MKRIFSAFWALVLICACVFSLFPDFVKADENEFETVEYESVESYTDVAQDEAAYEDEAPETDTESSEAEVSDAETVEIVEADAETSEAEDASVETVSAEAIEENSGITEEADAKTEDIKTVSEVQVSSAAKLSLKYDDRYSFENDYSGYTIESITTTKVNSYQVSKGKNTGTEDTAVLTQNGDTGVIASGCGIAVVILSKNSGSGDRIQVTVTVDPATLTLMFIAGQSNAEGLCGSSYNRNQSITCEAGTVYSTFAPRSVSSGKSITGISFSSACTKSNASNFVAGSLTGAKNIKGNALEYPIDSLSANGKGKTGIDSALAYRWNQLTGDKVWVVNAAYSATSITEWVPGAEKYERAEAVYDYAYQTYEAEISAGHYTRGMELLFWQQGESDKSMSATDYYTYFKALCNGLKKDFSYLDGIGVIMVRASSGSYTNSEDLALTGPRTIQYMLGMNTTLSLYKKLFVVSNANEQWVSNSGVKSYFSSKYGSSLSYPTKSSVSVPTTVADVHPNIHYTQLGHNENGLTAAEGMYYALKGGTASSVSLRDENYDKVTGSSLGSGAVVVPVANPVYYAKSITISASGATWSLKTGIVESKSKTGKLKVKSSGGSTLSTLSFTFYPGLKSVKIISKGIKISWGKLSGAKKYRVYRKVSGGSWKKIANTTSTSYTDKTAKIGKTYYYTVRAVYSSGKLSKYDTVGLKMKYLKTPVLKSAVPANGGIKVSWKSVSGAKKYGVYRKVSGGSWKKIANTTSTSYVDKTAKTGKTYYYTVRAINSDGITGSYYKTKGVKLKYLATPKLKTIYAASGGIKLTWKSVSGAKKYRVYRKVSGGSWKKLALTSSTSYTDKTAKAGKTYYYTVRAINSNGVLGSYYDKEGLSMSISSD